MLKIIIKVIFCLLLSIFFIGSIFVELIVVGPCIEIRYIAIFSALMVFITWLLAFIKVKYLNKWLKILLLKTSAKNQLFPLPQLEHSLPHKTLFLKIDFFANLFLSPQEPHKMFLKNHPFWDYKNRCFHTKCLYRIHSANVLDNTRDTLTLLVISPDVKKVDCFLKYKNLHRQTLLAPLLVFLEQAMGPMYLLKH